jgi:hypothetical protein
MDASDLGESPPSHHSLVADRSAGQKRKRSDGKVTTTQRRSMLSAISSIIRDAISRESDPPPAPTPPSSAPPPPADDALSYRKTRSETFVGEGPPTEDSFTDYQRSGLDIIAHLPPSTLQHTINFSSHRGGISALGKNLSIVSDPFEEELDTRNDSWQCIRVPHLPKSRAHRQRLPMFPIFGPVVQCAQMTTRYASCPSGSLGGSFGTGSFSGSPLQPSPNESYPREDSSVGDAPSSSPLPSSSGAGLLLATDVDRLVVLSSREDRDGELRLFDLPTLQLCALIRLSSVTKVGLLSSPRDGSLLRR